jgi:putative lipoic acid-binding regulatory protein
VLAQQVKDSDRGISLSARVDVAAMNAEGQEGLIKSMRAINELIKATLRM